MQYGMIKSVKKATTPVAGEAVGADVEIAGSDSSSGSRGDGSSSDSNVGGQSDRLAGVGGGRDSAYVSASERGAEGGETDEVGSTPVIIP